MFFVAGLGKYKQPKHMLWENCFEVFFVVVTNMCFFLPDIVVLEGVRMANLSPVNFMTKPEQFNLSTF